MANSVVPAVVRTLTQRLTHGCGHVWRSYVRFLDRHGWRAQAVNTCLLVGAGDVAAQLLIKRRCTLDSYDFTCSARYFGIGLAFLGPTMHVWYSGLDKVFVTSTLRAAVSKMLCDQLLFLPVYVVGIIIVMGVLRLESKTQILEQISQDYVQIMKTSYQIWPLIQIANFYFVPLKHRILVMNLVGLVYNTYVAWKVEQGAHNNNKKPRVRRNSTKVITVVEQRSDVGHHHAVESPRRLMSLPR